MEFATDIHSYSIIWIDFNNAPRVWNYLAGTMRTSIHTRARRSNNLDAEKKGVI